MDQDKTYTDGLVYAYKLMERYTKVGVYVIPVTGIMNGILNEIRSESKLDLSNIEIDQPLWYRPHN